MMSIYLRNSSDAAAMPPLLLSPSLVGLPFLVDLDICASCLSLRKLQAYDFEKINLGNFTFEFYWLDI